MLSKTDLRGCGITVAAFVLLTGSASADFKSLLARVPSDANAIALIDVQAMLESPLGVREGWKAKLANAYAEKPLMIAADTSRVVMAASIDPGDIDPLWEVSVMDLTKSPSLDLIARAEDGYIDAFGQVKAVWSPVNAYFLQFEPMVLGAACPDSRQFAARWAAGKLTPPGGVLSLYLASAAGAISPETPIVMAMDLQNITSATKVRRRIEDEAFSSLEGKKPDVDALSQLFGSIRGVTLRIAIKEVANGKGVIDFDRDTACLSLFAKPLMLELLSQAGALVDDFENWRFAAQGRQVIFEGRLSAEGLRRILSVVEPPAPAQADGSESESPGVNEKDKKAAATQKYYKTVRDTVQLLDRRVQAAQTKTLADFASWFKRDASTISRLPILNVDPDLVKFAADVSARLTEASRVMSQGKLQTQARTSAVRTKRVDSSTVSGGYYGGYYDGYYDGDNWHQPNISVQRSGAKLEAAAQQRQVAKEEKAKTAGQVAEIFNGIKAEAEKLRVELTNRYQVEF